MKKYHIFPKILAVVLIATLAVGLSAVAVSTDSDPLITLSYLQNIFKPAVLEEAEELAEDMEDALEDMADQLEKALDDIEITDVSNDYTSKSVKTGDTITVTTGSEILWLSGSATVGSSCLTDTTAGATVPASGALTVYHLYVATANGTLSVTSDGTYLVK